ncbi:unnamed protein product [Adineta steineri]|uniref:Uncharacterized protein n=1 Tax=Adineta steineri TaxID=433720 RepID=A0A819YVS2_9BILA|nr:unnamed protein product [Adineta steineri]CAF4155013.1 unnamed protein product [Adineta steineri]
MTTSSSFSLDEAQYATWKAQTGNDFAEVVEKEIKQWLITSATKLLARRDINNAIIAEMKAALGEGNNVDAEARAKALVSKGEQCLQAAQAERNQAQKEFEQIFTPIQKIRIIVHAVEAVNDPIKAADVLAAILHDACHI